MLVAPHPRVPLSYRVLFTLLDPLICLHGVYIYLFDHAFVLHSFHPSASAHPDGHTAALLRQLAGVFAMTCYLSATLPRVTADLRVWKALQAGIALLDAAILVSLVGVFADRGVLGEYARWRPEDWGSVAMTAFVFTVRCAFLAEVGFGEGGKVKGA